MPAIEALTLVPSTPSKFCTKCKTVRPLDDFRRAKDRRDGRAGWCIPCVRVYLASGVKRKSRLKTTYGITPKQFDEMLAAQRGGCASCGAPPKRDRIGRTNMHVDHDHMDGHVRGILCHFCNTALGLLHNDPDRITRLWQYLDRDKDRMAGR